MHITAKTITNPRLHRWNVEIKQRGDSSFYVIVCDAQKLWNDNPIRVDGRILYDFPERIPAYAKQLVFKAFTWIDSQS